MRSFRAYLADLRRDAGSKLWVALALVAGGALLEGIGILAILPFAAIITGQVDTDVAHQSLDVLQAVGLTTPLQRAIALVTFFLALMVLRGVVIWKRDTTLFAMGLGYVDRWRNRLFEAIGQADWLTVSGLRRTDLEHTITNDVNRLSSGTDRLLRTGAAVALALVELLILAALSPLLLLLVFLLFALALGVTLPLLRKAEHLGERLTSSGRRIHGVLGDFMTSQKLARLNNSERRFHQRFESSVREVRGHQFAFYSSQALARMAFQIAAGFVVVCALLTGIFVLGTPLSILVVTLVVLARLVGPVQTIAQTGQAIANALPAYDTLTATHAELVRSAVRDAEQPPCTAASFTDRHGPASLEVTNLRFTYPSEVTPVLDDVSFTIGAGRIVALKGSSGAGKTTLLDIITGLLPATAGSVRVDGNSLSSASSLHAWRDQIAYLPQDPFLFDASLRENLCWSARECDETAIAEALEVAGASEFVARAAGGLDAKAGERGQAFSGGERQRLCLARALLRQPRLLILDEATNALDTDREDRVLAKLTKMTDRFSILLVTHRTGALKHADTVLELRNGKVHRQ